MLLYDIIRDWFVINIWGGSTSDFNSFGGVLGHIFYDGGEGIAEDYFRTYDIGFPLGSLYNNPEGKVTPMYITLGDWLSTTSTIIVLVALCFFFFLMVRWLFRLTAGLIQGRG